jgi:transcriptional regulator with XRE-family HTH domain
VELLRIGDKIISRQQIDRWITRILDLRRQGHSQQEVAQKLKIDRTFVSRLESLGELRKGKGVAVIGFPVANGPELAALCRQYGVDWYLFFSEQERLDFVSSKSGLELFNQVMEILASIRKYDTVIVMGSNKRVQGVEALLDRDVIPIELGPSPLTADVAVDPRRFETILRTLFRQEVEG